MEWNGMEWNGMEWNGMEWNGMEWNGMEWNGMEWIISQIYHNPTSYWRAIFLDGAPEFEATNQKRSKPTYLKCHYDEKIVYPILIFAAVGSTLILTWVTYVLCPDFFADLCIFDEFSIY